MEKFKVYVLLLMPFLGVFIMETILRGNILLTFEWMFEYWWIYFLSVGIYFIVHLILVSLLNNIYLASFISFVIWIFAATVNFYKIEMMGDPILPWDFLYANQIFDLIPALYKNVNLVLLIGFAIAVIVVIGLLIKYTSFKAFNWKVRVGSLVVLIVCSMLLYNFDKNFIGKVFKATDVESIPWNQVESQQRNGMILGFLLNVPNIRVEKPNQYSAKSMESVNLEVDKLLVNGEYLTTGEKPNVVMIMSEAFWDLKKIGITEDGSTLTPTVDDNQIGEIVSPRYGGGTSTVEFEALTGFSMTNLPGGSVPYQQFLVKETPSLARTFKEHGYSTTAIHTYYKYFWNRIKAYETLGFDQFIGLDDLENPATYGWMYVDDQVITDEIMKTIEASDEPSFIYAVTMLNHGLYNDERYGENTMQVVDQYSDESNQILNNLATGYKRSDEAYADLLERIEALNEPTLVVFFGDHLPSMNSTYEEVGFVKNIEKKSLKEELKMKQTPLAVWNNYGQKIEPVGNISTSFLPPLVMEWAQLPGIGYYSVLKEMLETMPAYTAVVKETADGKLVKKTPAKYTQLENMYKMIQYDMMFGERYGEATLFEVMENGAN